MAKLNPKISFVEKTWYFELINFLDEKYLRFQNEVDSFQETSDRKIIEEQNCFDFLLPSALRVNSS